MPRMGGHLDIVQVNDPGTPVAGRQHLYFKSDGVLYTKKPDGSVVAIGTGAAPTNMVTTDTAQSITGSKSFTSAITEISAVATATSVSPSQSSNYMGFVSSMWNGTAAVQEAVYIRGIRRTAASFDFALQSEAPLRVAPYDSTNVQAATFLGGKVSGPPTAGTYQQKDFLVTITGKVFICTVGGTPGTWVDAASLPPSGLPTGGTVNQVLSKTGTPDYQAAWIDLYAAKTFTTPASGTVSTQLLIPLTTLAAFSQVMAFGVNAASPASARALAIFDARTIAHQPTQIVFNPIENDGIGFNWNGSNADALISTLSGTISLAPNGRTSATAPLTVSDTAAGLSTQMRGVTGLIGRIGADVPFRFVGGTVSGVPTQGTWTIGDVVFSQTGKIYTCTVAGTPGTWVDAAVTPTNMVTTDTTQTITGIKTLANRFDLTAMAEPASPAASNVTFYAINDAGGVARMRLKHSDGTTSAIRAIEPYVMSVTGSLTVLAGKSRIYLEDNYVVESIRASVNTSPAGASVIVDVNKNGITLFTTQTSRPTIAPASFLSTNTAPAVTTFTAGDYITVDVDQIGTTTAGSDLTVTIRLRRN